jgi:hypothetical protein
MVASLVSIPNLGSLADHPEIETRIRQVCCVSLPGAMAKRAHEEVKPDAMNAVIRAVENEQKHPANGDGMSFDAALTVVERMVQARAKNVPHDQWKFFGKSIVSYFDNTAYRDTSRDKPQQGKGPRPVAVFGNRRVN